MMLSIKTLPILAMVAAFALVAAVTTAATEIQPAEADQTNNGCKNANCQGVNANQNSNNFNEDSFNFEID
jgi:hypothetical protein